MPERTHRFFFLVDSAGVIETDSLPDDEFIAEIERTREILFSSNENAINNFRDNIPGGRRRYEYTPRDIMLEYKKENPESYAEYAAFYKDIDNAIEEAGLDIQLIAQLQSNLLAAVHSIDYSDPESVDFVSKCSRLLDRYIFPAYEILRLKYGYSVKDLCS
jgi:hypothetical protein